MVYSRSKGYHKHGIQIDVGKEPQLIVYEEVVGQCQQREYGVAYVAGHDGTAGVYLTVTVLIPH